MSIRHSRDTSVIPACLNVIPATPPSFPRTREPRERQSTPFPSPSGAVHNLTDDGFTVGSHAPLRCPAPLDSGFRRNDGSYAQLPFAERRGRVRSTQGMPENHHNPHFIHASNRNPRDSSVSIPRVRHSRGPSFSRLLRHSRASIRHSRGRGNPEKNKARRLIAPTETVVFMFLGSRVRGNDVAWAGMTSGSRERGRRARGRGDGCYGSECCCDGEGGLLWDGLLR